MKLQHIALVCLLALSAGNVTAQMLHRPDSMYTFTDPRLQKKHPWRAAAETFGMNVGVWAFDRYVMNEDFAKISIGSIRRNIKHGFVWDNDQFSTNQPVRPPLSRKSLFQCSTQQRTYLLGIGSIRLCW